VIKKLRLGVGVVLHPSMIHFTVLVNKVNFALEQAMKTQRGSRGIAPLFL
jgi:hypothetical protein